MGAGHRQPSWDGADACLGSGRALDRLFAPRPAPAPRPAGQIPPSDADARGISVWAGGLLEDQHVQSLIRYQPLQPRVLLLELLKLLRHRRIHATELRSPAVVRLLADPQPSADIWNIHALPKIHVSLPKQANNLLCTVSLLHLKTLSNPTWGTRILSQELAQNFGRGSITRASAAWISPGACFVVSDVTFEQLIGSANWSQYSATIDLVRAIANPSLGVTGDIPLRVHARFTQPILDMGLLLLGIPLVLGPKRRGVFAAAGGSVGMTILFFLVVMGSHALALADAVTPSLGAWLPVLVLGPLAAWSAEPMWR